MLRDLKLFLTNSIELSDVKIKEIRDYFNEVLNYNEMDSEKPIDILADIYNTFVDIYPYCGTVYRGVFVDYILGELKQSTEICSFTSNKNVAENFALRGDKGIAYLIMQHIDNGLDFGVLLNDLHDKKILLTEDVETFLGEDEVLCKVSNDCEIKQIAELD